MKTQVTTHLADPEERLKAMKMVELALEGMARRSRVTAENIEPIVALVVDITRAMKRDWARQRTRIAPNADGGAPGRGVPERAVGTTSAGVRPVRQSELFTVILTAPGDKKIQVIKVVRELTGLGLKEAKAVADEAPKLVKAKVSKAEAEDMKQKLEEVGGTVEIKSVFVPVR